MKKIFHIVGTDTDIGKTYVTCQLISHFQQLGYNSNGLKPLSTGTTISINNEINSTLTINPDSFLLQQVNSQKLHPNIINPINYPEAIAPHIAAKNHTQLLNAIIIETHIQNSLEHIENGYTFIEGIGGIMVPLNNTQTYLDLLNICRYPIIVVIGIKLGCLNHAQLTINTLKQYNLPILGWIANLIDKEQAYQQENIDYLIHKLDIPLIALAEHNQPIKITHFFRDTL